MLRVITFKVDESIVEDIDIWAKRLNVNRSMLIRSSIKVFLAVIRDEKLLKEISEIVDSETRNVIKKLIERQY